LTMGAMIAAAMLMQRTTAPVDNLTSSWNLWHLASDSIKRIENLISTEEIEKIENNESCTELKLENISINSDLKSTPVLNDISIKFVPGEIVAVTGPSGSGKSMLLKTILGINSNFEGNIFFNQYNASDLSDTFFSNQVGYLAQEVTMFNGTIAENISRMSTPDSNEVFTVARLVGIHYFILKLPGSYDTLIEAGTESLSGGERQRIGIARALYKKPSVILLDEPNSSLDNKGELALAHAMRHMKKLNCIIIVVTHRLSLIPACDRVITLNNGNLISDLDIDMWKQNLKNNMAKKNKI